ncbi:hypothetical protein ACJX0J_037614, partial [Zea mays]
IFIATNNPYTRSPLWALKIARKRHLLGKLIVFAVCVGVAEGFFLFDISGQIWIDTAFKITSKQICLEFSSFWLIPFLAGGMWSKSENSNAESDQWTEMQDIAAGFQRCMAAMLMPSLMVTKVNRVSLIFIATNNPYTRSPLWALKIARKRHLLGKLTVFAVCVGVVEGFFLFDISGQIWITSKQICLEFSSFWLIPFLAGGMWSKSENSNVFEFYRDIPDKLMEILWKIMEQVGDARAAGFQRCMAAMLMPSELRA